MSIQLCRPVWIMLAATAGVTSALLGGCTGSGAGLDANGNPLGSGSSAPEPLSADFQSIQDNIFTPICTRCHIGANAPEGLQLDQAHSYALLVGVPSSEVPSVLRVKAGDPANSYVIKKLQGSGGIVGVQMPFGGPYLPQSTIDVIAQWITNGASQTSAGTSAVANETRREAAASPLLVTATMPADGGEVAAPLNTIAIGFSEQAEVAFLSSAVQLQNISGPPMEVPVTMVEAQGNPSTVLLTPLVPLAPGTYRVTLHGGVTSPLMAVSGEPLAADYSFTFTVDMP